MPVKHQELSTAENPGSHPPCQLWEGLGQTRHSCRPAPAGTRPAARAGVGPGLWGRGAMAASSPAWPGPGERGDPQQHPPQCCPSQSSPISGSGLAWMAAVWLLKGSVRQELSHASSPSSLRRHEILKLGVWQRSPS